MGKLDLNCVDFDDEKALMPVSPDAELARLDHNEGLPLAPVAQDQGAARLGLLAMATGGPNVVAVVSIVDHVLHAATEINRCWTEVAKEKQQTERFRELAKIQIEADKQQTKRVQIQQVEETRRFAMQCKKELELKCTELKGLRDELRLQDAQRRDGHQNCMLSLDMLDKSITVLISQSNDLRKMLQKDADGVDKQTIFQQMDKVNENLVKLADDIVKLRQG